MSTSGRAAEASLAMPFRGHAGFASVPVSFARAAVCNDRSTRWKMGGSAMSMFPLTRLRRLRRTSALRSLVRETRLDLANFVFPVFVADEPLRNEALPEFSRLTVEELVAEADECARLGVPALMLFGIPEEKDEQGSGAWDDDGIVQRALRAVRERTPQLTNRAERADRKSTRLNSSHLVI